jgi:GNAT superfamily N-acetyltransferase
MDIIEINPGSRQDQKRFLQLPFRIYQGIPQWVPPLASEASRIFDQKKHPFYQNGEAAFFLALDQQGMPCGRVAALNHHKYNEYNHDNAAFFYLFECINDRNISQALFDRVIDWAKSHGLTKIIGPKGFTALDGLGLLIKGFEHRPAFGLPYNPPYYPELIEAAGFTPSGEIVCGYLDPKRMVLPEKIEKVAELVQKRRGMQVVRFNNRRELVKIIPELQKLYNDSLEGTTRNIPLTETDLRTMANQLLWFANPRLIKIIRKDGALVGFLLAYPDISAAVQRCRGRLFPIGWLDLLLEIRRTRWVNINGAAIVEKYRGMGGTALLFKAMYDSIREGGFDHVDLVQIGADNEKMQLELRSLGIDFYKCHRLYQKMIG